MDRHSALPDGLTWRSGVIHIETMVGGSRISRSCKTTSVPEARRLLETLRGQIRIADLTGIKAHVLKPKASLEEFIDQELARLQVDGSSPKTLVKYKGVMTAFARYVRHQVKRSPALEDITHGMVQSYKSHAATTLRTRNGATQGLGRLPAMRTIANELDVIRVFLRKAVQRGLLASNPESGVERGRGAYEPRVRWLNDDEIGRLLTAAATWDEWAHRSGRPVGDLYALVIEFYLRTGLRLEEFRNLPLTHTTSRDPQGRRLLTIGAHVVQSTFCCSCSPEEADEIRQRGRQAASRMLPPELGEENCRLLTYYPATGLILCPLTVAWKPKSRLRQLPLSPRAEQIFQILLKRRQSLLAARPAIAACRALVKAPEPPWLVPDPSGAPWRFSMQAVMDRCSTQAGITPRVRTHDLRHTFATQLRRRGVPIETIQELLGHADIAETLIYAHFTMSEAIRSIDLIDEVASRS